MATKFVQNNAAASKTASKTAPKMSWADMEDEELSGLFPPPLVRAIACPNKPSYAFVAKTGVADDDTCGGTCGSVCESVCDSVSDSVPSSSPFFPLFPTSKDMTRKVDSSIVDDVFAALPTLLREVAKEDEKLFQEGLLDLKREYEQLKKEKSNSKIAKRLKVLEGVFAKFKVEGAVSDSVPDSVPDSSSDFTLVQSRTKKKSSMAKCESALAEWARNKGSKPVVKCSGDEQIVCKRCSAPFVFGEKAKERYAERGWKMPKICKACSQARFEEKA